MICAHTFFKPCQEAFYSHARSSRPVESQAYLLRCITWDLFSAQFHVWAQPGLVPHCAGHGTRSIEPRLEEMDPNGRAAGNTAWQDGLDFTFQPNFASFPVISFFHAAIFAHWKGTSCTISPLPFQSQYRQQNELMARSFLVQQSLSQK